MSIVQASAVAIAGRALLLCGPSGSGKSTLALSLIDRGAVLIGDDGVTLEAVGGRLMAAAPPRTAGLIEVRNLGLLPFPLAPPSPVALLIDLVAAAPRFIDQTDTRLMEGVAVPAVQLTAHAAYLALKAELALAHYGATWPA